MLVDFSDYFAVRKGHVVIIKVTTTLVVVEANFGAERAPYTAFIVVLSITDYQHSLLDILGISDDMLVYQIEDVSEETDENVVVINKENVLEHSVLEDQIRVFAACINNTNVVTVQHS